MRVKEIPKRLKQIKNPPKELYYEGELSLLERESISIVGSRRPNQYTKQMTLLLAQKLSSMGYVIVSGAAMGVDALAHKGAYPSTISVMANSLDIIYPKINQTLIEKMRENSLLLSEYPPTTKATRYSFVLRNRIVVALSKTLIIMEADLNSGTLRSFEYAKQMGKEVYVLSHRVGDSLGTQMLLKSGLAKSIVDIDHFLSNFGDIDKDDKSELSFFDKPRSLDEALDRFGERIYELELDGVIDIKDFKVFKR